MGSTACDSKELEWGALGSLLSPRVRLLRNALTSRSIAATAPSGLPTGSLTVLSLIAANPHSSQAALAKRAGINKSALVGIVDQLEAKGLAARDRSEVDRRRNTLTVTKDGLEAMERLHAAVAEIEAPIAEALGAAELTALIALLEKANAALTSAEEDCADAD